MDLYEHQARELFKEHGIVVPRAEVTDSPERAREIARALGGRAVVKAQVKTGGRGKAGGVRLAADPAEAEEAARHILGMDIRGHTVDTVMLAEPCEIEREFYVSYVLDRASGGFLAIASAEGGTEIEEVAARRPEAVARIPVDPATGVHTATAVRIADAAGLPPQTVDTLVRLWKVLVREDALLVEVNPLVRTAEGRIVALDGKVTLDDNARFRQSRWGETRQEDADSLEARAGAKGLNYVKLDGEVGVIGNGAGLVMSTLDVVAGCGARPANFLDIGGGASARVMADGLSVVLSDPDVRSVLVNVFGGITACDAVADGIVRALDEVRLTKPLVVRLDGNNAARGRALLDARAHPLVEQATTMDGAARRAARLATAASTAGQAG
ncbi:MULTISPECIES: ADP-forming succinate--CoA ligase subunit beta [Streptomyces]|uniref:Succinate--CoA ligase [ADP-forming] subunit beta 2 n=1 Tax=Streptomyces coelicolor (strain ATCC BAA-471 / A3(2) / M145) TaxID=100226 RepID=SUCC2_STRCO|nr:MULTISPECIES: ADP-forming succinate--CoA ligase subunit beta [Streptomyces]O87840.1 RecName: Full=Succinate--CoA ligase [ADP-forming] subunit beta 2; AltName: Full=Succinyl-CoA synthetase subunit beta 2; Short=SCS-beta 2 [Streptomyces coelicolor A3(2)]MDX2923767.1 ADP-forming succinate--CoA ligase subunit beta [Streptomyces sp. NRRL_B-16638]MDX3409437.1 ADP-forming succinate--CoA ligase subunit beta [Streptomyces sp. ME02-6977A]MYU46089.1 ADP-forming succinate--CoA ligase subunit beta [Strep